MELPNYPIQNSYENSFGYSSLISFVVCHDVANKEK